MKFLKEVFSEKNMKIAMLMGLFANPNLTGRDYLNINKDSRSIRNEEELQQRKAA